MTRTTTNPTAAAKALSSREEPAIRSGTVRYAVLRAYEARAAAARQHAAPIR